MTSLQRPTTCPTYWRHATVCYTRYASCAVRHPSRGLRWRTMRRNADDRRALARSVRHALPRNTLHSC